MIVSRRENVLYFAVVYCELDAQWMLKGLASEKRFDPPI